MALGTWKCVDTRSIPSRSFCQRSRSQRLKVKHPSIRTPWHAWPNFSETGHVDVGWHKKLSKAGPFRQRSRSQSKPLKPKYQGHCAYGQMSQVLGNYQVGPAVKHCAEYPRRYGRLRGFPREQDFNGNSQWLWIANPKEMMTLCKHQNLSNQLISELSLAVTCYNVTIS